MASSLDVSGLQWRVFFTPSSLPQLMNEAGDSVILEAERHSKCCHSFCAHWDKGTADAVVSLKVVCSYGTADNSCLTLSTI